MTRVSRISRRRLLLHFVLPLMAAVIANGCVSAQKTFDPDLSGPQLIVQPDTIRMGVVSLLSARIVFKGKGFEPGDSVFISLIDVPEENGKTDIPIAESDIDEQGKFTAEVERIVKVTEFLQATIDMNENMETVVKITRDPIPPREYTVRAFSMEHDKKKAECALTVKKPSLIDRFKDWIGGIKGKIVKPD